MPEYWWKNSNRWIGSALVLAVLIGCAYPARPTAVTEDWISQGSGAFHTDDGALFQGVAFAQGIQNMTLLKTAAANRANAQLNALLDQYVRALVQYAGLDMAAIQTRQMFREIVQKSLENASITDHWYDRTNQKSYARCALTLDTFKRILRDVSAPQALKTDMVNDAGQIFEAFVSAPNPQGNGR